MITNSGLNNIANSLDDWLYIAGGTDATTPPAATDTGVNGSELFRVLRDVYDVVGALATIEALLAANVGNGSIGELAIMSAAAAGDCYQHETLGVAIENDSDNEFLAIIIITFTDQ